jgi:hypothetical protein
VKVFDRALSQLTIADQKALEDTLCHWRDETATGRHVDWNLRNEEWLPMPSMKQLQQTLSACTVIPIPALETIYQVACYTHVGKGGVASPTPSPSIVGHVVDKETFASYLTNEYPGTFPNTTQADIFVNKLLHGARLTDEEKKIRVRRRIMWATFEQANASASPFEFTTTDLAEEIRASLGLDQRHPSGPLVMFYYPWAAPTDMLRPTVADAGLHYNFQQSSAKTHGMTRPWAEGVHKNGSSYDAKPRPEVVHYPIELGATLKVEIRDD